jgi:putative protein-disulfide isomerase
MPVLNLFLYLLLTGIISLNNNEKHNTMSKIIYFQDPLCGWCYGFGPVIKKISVDYKDKYQFQVVSGGMIPDAKSGSINEIAPFIKEAYKTVEENTGIRFGDNFIKNVLMPGNAILNSEKPSRAITICKLLKPENSISFVHDLQWAFYQDGKDLQDDATYRPLAKLFGMDEDHFRKMLNDPLVAGKTQEDYQITSSLGINGFPTLVYQDTDTMLILSRGFSAYEELKQRIDSIPHYLNNKP